MLGVLSKDKSTRVEPGGISCKGAVRLSACYAKVTSLEKEAGGHSVLKDPIPLSMQTAGKTPVALNGTYEKQQRPGMPSLAHLLHLPGVW